jgi:hypothetical protein
MASSNITIAEEDAVSQNVSIPGPAISRKHAKPATRRSAPAKTPEAIPDPTSGQTPDLLIVTS